MRLQILGLEKRFGTKTAVDGISFRAAPGEVIGLLGPNGAGKSTSIKMLVGLTNPTGGQILCDEQPIDSDIVSYKARIGYVPEEPQLYSYMSGLEYLRLVGHLRALRPEVMEARIERLLKLFSLFPARHRPIGNYSKGMKQKVLLCTALMHNPEVLILDEPLSGLDVTAVLVLQNLIKRLASMGRTIIYSSHILETAEKLCSRVIIIHHGKLVADASVLELKRLKEQPSLEVVFAQLALDQDPNQIAGEIVGAIEE